VIEHCVHFGHDVLTVHDDGRITRRTESRVQNRAILREIDLFSTKHRVDTPPQLGLLCQPEQQVERFTCDSILGVVEKKAYCLGGQTFAALRIICKKLS